jgi:hypothetical protein
VACTGRFSDGIAGGSGCGAGASVGADFFLIAAFDPNRATAFCDAGRGPGDGGSARERAIRATDATCVPMLAERLSSISRSSVRFIKLAITS